MADVSDNSNCPHVDCPVVDVLMVIMMKFPVLAFILAFLMLGSASFASINISDCAILNESGETYYLTADIIDSSAIKCMNIIGDNIALDCQDYIVDGAGSAGIFVDNDILTISINSKNITIKNCILTGWDFGAFFKNVTDSLMADSDISSGGNENSYGISFDVSSHIVLASLNISNIFNMGIVIDSSDNVSVIDSVVNDNGQYGIYFYKVQDCIVSNSSFRNNVGANIIIEQSVRTEIVNSSFINSASDYGIALSLSSNNTFYNNLFNSTVNVFFEEEYGFNAWNITKQDGTRIYSDGTMIGGNYWVNYSDACADADIDGFCDSPYDVYTGLNCTAGVDCGSNTDYFSLSDEYEPPTTTTTTTTLVPITTTTTLPFPEPLFDMSKNLIVLVGAVSIIFAVAGLVMR